MVPQDDSSVEELAGSSSTRVSAPEVNQSWAQAIPRPNPRSLVARLSSLRLQLACIGALCSYSVLALLYGAAVGEYMLIGR
jgi:hypothetical protein